MLGVPPPVKLRLMLPAGDRVMLGVPDGERLMDGLPEGERLIVGLPLGFREILGVDRLMFADRSSVDGAAGPRILLFGVPEKSGRVIPADGVRVIEDGCREMPAEGVVREMVPPESREIDGDKVLPTALFGADRIIELPTDGARLNSLLSDGDRVTLLGARLMLPAVESRENEGERLMLGPLGEKLRGAAPSEDRICGPW